MRPCQCTKGLPLASLHKTPGATDTEASVACHCPSKRKAIEAIEIASGARTKP